ncbi:vitamin B12-dependent ribonucleotide reductase [Clostridium tagluense]|uniref:Vitamin B12-dependent ribonucleotide reductase n=1 Tax=Clostridium tagluense TaxID=360422 RepID=A0A401UQA0_9CLOT|nr:vitamin B12-dependent ribonucleotide reductase [Clostridium tagluense]GCD11732.1 vitamin B12-dependent ribonucleotide reductase [Clostridium tagluense]
MKDMNLKDLIVRRYTKELEGQTKKSVYDLFKWKKVDVSIKDYKLGTMIYEGIDLDFPEDYSQHACDIIASKYFKMANVQNDRGYEYSLKEVIHRMVKFWVESATDEKLITVSEGVILYDELAYMFLKQMFAPNSPQWFNTGLKYYPSNEETDGNFYYNTDLKKVVQSKDRYTRTQASACFIIGIEDKLLGAKSISEQYVTETKLFKGGSGTGSNFSVLRAKGERLSGGGVSSGVMTFLKGYDANAGSIKSGGTLRRSAKMNQLFIDHPEIMDYITWKSKEEEKVRALGKMGYDTSFGGEAYETVAGQNANNTVRMTDEFMYKVDEYVTKGIDSKFELKGRVDSSVNKIVDVSTLWDAFVSSAHDCADPAPAFDGTFNAWHTCPRGEDGEYNAPHNRINSTNPCGEYAFLDDTACNLASINILKFYNEETKIFDVEGYKHCIGLLQIMLEASIHWGHFPTEDVARRTHMFRTTGLGIANLSGLLMTMGLPYDSEVSRNLASSLTSILTGQSYFTSSLMAKKIGAFEKYDINKDDMLKVIRNHSRVSKVINSNYEGLNYSPIELNHQILLELNWINVSDSVKTCWINALGFGELYGYRNAQVTVIAPTGTISFAMDCQATSIEPFFSHVAYKKLADGGMMIMVNPLMEKALFNLGYNKIEVKDITDYVLAKNTDGMIKDGKLEGAPHLKEEHLPIFDTANKCGTGNRYIKPMAHVLMMACLTPMLSGAISKTVNLPKGTLKQKVSEIFLQSYKLGCKGITIYIDGSKVCQPLNSTIDGEFDVMYEDMSYNDLIKKAYELEKQMNKPRRDKINGIRRGTTHPAEVADIKVYTTVNRRENGEICEIYITTDREGGTITGLLNSLSKSISVMLQNHVAPIDIANMLKGQKYEPNGFVSRHPNIKYCDSISDLISRIIEMEIGDYSRCQVKPIENIVKPIVVLPIEKEIIIKQEQITEIEKPKGKRLYGEICSNCHSDKLVQNGTCKVCLDCATTTGCS